MQNILIKIGFFLFELGVAIIARLVFGSDNKEKLEGFIAALESTDKTGEEKFKATKEYLEGLSKSAPDIVKHIVIEAAVAKTHKQTKKLLDSINR